jgi:hypothetical protein
MTCPICTRPVLRDMTLLRDGSLAHEDCVTKRRTALAGDIRKRIMTNEWQFIEHARLAARRLPPALALRASATLRVPSAHDKTQSESTV